MDVEILVDGNFLEINDFVKKIAYELNTGLLRSLHGAEDWKKLEIRIKK